jgi:PAS domain S-box-containing protein
MTRAARKSYEQLVEELEALRSRIEEPEATVDALRKGEVDAVVVNGPFGEEVYTLEGAERPYRLLIEVMQQGAATVSREGIVVYCNQYFAELLGRRQEDVIGAPVRELVVEDDRSPLMRMLADACRESIRGEARLLRGDGSSFPGELVLHTLPFRGMLCLLISDLTRQRQYDELLAAQEQLAESQQRLRAILDNTPAVVYVVDSQGRFLYVNRHWDALFRLGVEQVAGRLLEECFPQDTAEQLRANNLRVLEARTACQFEEAVLQSDGWHTYLSVKVPLFDKAGVAYAVCGISTDITARKRAEEASCERARLMSYTAEIGMALAQGDALPDVLRRCCEATVRGLDASLAGIWTFHEPENVLELQAGAGLGTPSLEAHRRIPAGSTIIGRVAQGRTPHLTSAVPEDLQVLGPEEARSEELAAFAGFPLVVEGRLIGVMAMFARRPLSEAALEAMSAVANGVAVGIQRKQAEQALREDDRRKDEFLALLAHELRNPLAPIRNALGVMRLEPIEHPDLRWARDVLERQVEQLTRLVDDLLDVSRITRGKIALRKEPMAVSEVIARAVETSRPWIDERRHRLELSLPPEPILLLADPTRLTQAVANLINNAAKYTEPGGRIEVSALRAAGEAVLRVRDTGVGIAPEMLPDIFNMFTQVDRSLDRSQGGLGIGLTLVRRLVELHDGSVKAYSDGPGHGSEFVIRLPCLPGSAGAERQAEAPPPRRDLPRTCRILIVDDNHDAANSLSRLLRISGYESSAAYGGVQALEMAQANPPDVVLLDIGMPGMDGYDVARGLRALPGMERVVLVALTGYGQEGDRRLTEAAGFELHLVKPVDLAELHALLDRVSSRQA